MLATMFFTFKSILPDPLLKYLHLKNFFYTTYMHYYVTTHFNCLNLTGLHRAL